MVAAKSVIMSPNRFSVTIASPQVGIRLVDAADAGVYAAGVLVHERGDGGCEPDRIPNLTRFGRPSPVRVDCPLSGAGLEGNASQRNWYDGQASGTLRASGGDAFPFNGKQPNADNCGKFPRIREVLCLGVS